jgi:hypothetical protein
MPQCIFSLKLIHDIPFVYRSCTYSWGALWASGCPISSVAQEFWNFIRNTFCATDAYSVFISSSSMCWLRGELLQLCERNISWYSSYTADFKFKIIEYVEKLAGSDWSWIYHVGIQCVLLEEQKDAQLQTTNKSRNAFQGPKSGKLP